MDVYCLQVLFPLWPATVAIHVKLPTCGLPPISKSINTTSFVSPACPDLTYGPGCTKTCSCLTSNTDRCDPVLGCVCKTGWTGESCQDVAPPETTAAPESTTDNFIPGQYKINFH